MLRFLLGLPGGQQAPWMMSHRDVAPLLKAEKAPLRGGALLPRALSAFSDYDGVLAATTHAQEFCAGCRGGAFHQPLFQRRFMIFDKTTRGPGV